MPRGVYKRKGVKRAAVPAPVTRDAVIYLQHAERAILARVREGKLKRLPSGDLYSLLALAALRGD